MLNQRFSNRELGRLRDWLIETGCTHVVMESTGSYWRPVFEVLEDSVTVILANPEQVKSRRGHKTDWNDACWLAHLLRHDMVRASFIPPRAIRELRDLTRRRKQVLRDATSERNRIQKVLETANVKLPAEPFDLSQWSRAQVNIDYHIAFDANYYSVPYNLVQERVEVRSTPTTIELFHKGQRVASHLRARAHGHTVTIAEHRPRSHQAHLEWTPSRMLHWAQTIGPHTARLFERIMNDKPHPEMGYRSCLGIIHLAGKYSPTRLEAAAERALVTGACRYQSVKSILKNSLEAVPPVEPPPTSPPPPHDNIRGAGYFD